jgi:hypothetical protein
MEQRLQFAIEHRSGAISMAAPCRVSAGRRVFVVHDEVAPCTGWLCGFKPPPVLPTVEISLRYRFF